MIEKELQALGATYRLDKISGKGGSASVYKAYRLDSDGHSRQTVALKILQNKNAIPWLRKEFETLTQIRSVHCAQVYAWETLQVGPALMMEWIDGVTLYEFARSSHFQKKFIPEIVAQTEAGLRELTASGLHHGDLSPKNILIDRAGLIRIVDFATATSKSGQIVGTPAYLSPQIWRGAATSIESDLFALRMIEFDLANSFMQVPKTAAECKKRAYEAEDIEAQMSWALSSPPLREALGSAVNRHLDENSAMSERTQILLDSKLSKKTRVLALRLSLFCSLIAFSLMIVTVRAQAPAPSHASQVSASLKVASNRWILISLNGKDAGYAPIHLKTLLPGRHRLAWKTSSGRGETWLHLLPGQRMTLTETDLSRLE
jgi:serine/threonine protein kinase